jgi:hypothetical protein
MDTQEHTQEQADTLAQEHEAQEQERAMSNVETFTKRLGDLIRRHKEGEPVYAEMAARIEARNLDPHGLLE